MIKIQNQVASWSNPHCAITDCQNPPVKILRIEKAGWDIPSAEPHPFQGGEQWTIFTYTPCQQHETDVRNYLISRHFDPDAILEIGGENEILLRQKEDQEYEKRLKENSPPPRFRNDYDPRRRK